MSKDAPAGDGTPLRELPPGWSWARVSEVGEVKLGRQRSPEHHTGLHMRPYLRVANVYEDRIDLSDVLEMNFTPEEYEVYRLKHGDILLNEGQSLELVGRPALYRDELPGGCFQNTLVRFRAGEAVNPRFALLVFRHYLHAKRFQKLARWTVNIAHLGAARFAEVEFPIPPRREQARIVAKAEELLSDLDNGVAALERARANLKKYRAAVLKAAVTGELTADWRAARPNVEPACQVLKRIQPPPRPARYGSRSKDIVPGHPALSVGATGTHLPAGWSWSPLVDIARMESGHTPSREHPEWWDGDIPWVGILDAKAHHGGTITETIQHTNQDGLANSAARLLPTGTVCVSRTAASIGYVMVLGRPMATSQDFVNWIPTEAVRSDWLRVVFMVDREVLVRFGKGSTHKTVYFPEWLSLHVAVPPLAEQEAIATEVERRLSIIAATRDYITASLKRASRLRQSILKEAFAGRLVPQDPNDEPASVLLARIRTQTRVSTSPTRRPERRPPRQRNVKSIVFRRGAVLSYIVNRLSTYPSFGRTQLAKALHLTQTHVGIDLGFEFKRHPMGPLDEAMYKVEGFARKQGWFTFKNRKNGGVTYHAGPDIEERCRAAAAVFGDRLPEVDRLLAHFAGMNTDQAELFSTVYAAWNDLLIDGKETGDAAVVAEVYGWHESKKRFGRADILTRLTWMRESGYVPTGTGPRTQALPDKDGGTAS